MMTPFDAVPFGTFEHDLREIVVYCPQPDLPECMFTRKLQDHCYLMTAEQFLQWTNFSSLYYAALPAYHLPDEQMVSSLYFHPAKAMMYDNSEVRLLDYNEKLSVLCSAGKAGLVHV